ncbi:outer membrane beta-barrel protein [Negadavirga shengliensis]
MAQYEGKIVDKDTREPLFGAYIFLKDNEGETLSSGFTDEEGLFSVEKPDTDRFWVEISFMGYKDYRKRKRAPRTNRLGTFELENDGELMDAVEIDAPHITGEVKGDTVAFNADAYKTRPEADAFDLVRKMPGVVLQNGTIQVQGEDVEEVLVDGRPFFGDNPSAALRNLPAEVIDRIEFLDRQGDEAILTGFDDEENIKTINIITKEDKRAGRFGKFFGGYGSDNNYLAGGHMNFFREAQRLTVIGLSNNINQQNFSADDLSGAFGNTDNRRGGGNDLSVRSQPGITTTNAIGANFSDEYLDEKLKLTGSYLYNNRDNVLNRYSSRDYVLPNDSLQLYQEHRSNRNRSESHRLNFRIDYDINDRHALIIRPSLGYEKNRATNQLTAANLFDMNTPISETNNTTDSERQALSFRNFMVYRYNFKKTGRNFSTRVVTRYNDNEGISDLTAVNRNFQTDLTDSLIQNSTTASDGFNYNVRFTYTEPLGESSVLRADYQIANNISNTLQEVLRQEQETGVGRLDSTLSNQFENTYLTQRAGLGYRLRKGIFRMYANLRYQTATIDSDRIFPGFENIRRDFTNILPRLRMDFRFNRESNLRVDYRTFTNAPSIRQLQDVIDNSNPIQLSNGNAELNQEFTHRAFARYRKINPETSRSFMIYANAMVTQDFIGNETFIASLDTLIQGSVLLNQGGQYTRPVNLDNFWNFRTFVSWGFPLQFMSSNLNLHTRFNINNRPGRINEQTNFNRNTSIGQGFVLSSNISEHLDFNFSMRGNYNVVRSSLQENLNQDYYTQQTRLDLFWNFVGGLFISTNANHQLYRGLGEDFDQSIYLVNLDVGYRIPPSRKAEFKLTVFDLFNQNLSIDRNVTDVYVEDVRTQVLRQFVMLTFTYNLRSFGGYRMELE